MITNNLIETIRQVAKLESTLLTHNNEKGNESFNKIEKYYNIIETKCKTSCAEYSKAVNKVIDRVERVRARTRSNVEKNKKPRRGPPFPVLTVDYAYSIILRKDGEEVERIEYDSRREVERTMSESVRLGKICLRNDVKKPKIVQQEMKNEDEEKVASSPGSQVSSPGSSVSSATSWSKSTEDVGIIDTDYYYIRPFYEKNNVYEYFAANRTNLNVLFDSKPTSVAVLLCESYAIETQLGVNDLYGCDSALREKLIEHKIDDVIFEPCRVVYTEETDLRGAVDHKVEVKNFLIQHLRISVIMIL